MTEEKPTRPVESIFTLKLNTDGKPTLFLDVHTMYDGSERVCSSGVKLRTIEDDAEIYVKREDLGKLISALLDAKQLLGET